MQSLGSREERGKLIASFPNAIARIDANEYRVRSQTCEEIEYQVVSTEKGWICSCPDSKFRQVKCKHQIAVELSFALRKAVEKVVVKIEQVTNPTICQYCKSQEIVRCGLRHNKCGDLQKYLCRSCNKYFTLNYGFEKMRATPQAITSAMQLYFSGESLRNVQKFLLLQGVRISHVSVLKWIRKYIELMDAYLEKIHPNVSNTWRTDEMFIKIKGKKNWLFSMMDDETRFWIAQQIADSKGTSDVRPMFQEAKEIAGKRPKVLISDGAGNFHDAYNKEYRTMWNYNTTKHIAHIRLQGDKNNNKMERFNGEQRDREKVMRSLKSQESPILKGMQIYHNYMRPHMALGNATPAEKCGIKIDGRNKWITLIENATLDSRNDKTN